MSRQNTDQLYIEIDYFTPEEYFVFTAEAQSQQAVSSSLNCASSKITQAQATLVVSASISATISHIEGADLFAFSEIQLAVQVDRIRETNIAASSVFDVATDVSRIQLGDADADAIFSAIINGLRSRDVNLDAQAAFSFECEATLIESTGVDVEANGEWTSQFDISATVLRIKTTNSNITASFETNVLEQRIRNQEAALESNCQLTISVEKIISVSSLLSFEFTQSCTISHIEGVDIVVQNFATLSATAVKQTENSAALNLVFQQTANGGRRQIGSALLTSRATIFVSRVTGSDRPTTIIGTFNSSSLLNSATRITNLSVLPNQSWYYQSRVILRASANYQSMDSKEILSIPLGTINGFAREITAVFRYRASEGLRIIINGLGASGLGSLGVGINNNNGCTFAISFNTAGNRTQFFVNGSRIAYLDNSSVNNWIATAPQTIRFGRDFPFTVSSSIHTLETDYAWMTTGAITGSNVTTFTPIDPVVNTDNTIFLYNFNGNGNETIGFNQFGQAALSADAALSAQANPNTKQGAVSLSTDVALTALGGLSISALAALSTEFTQSTSADRFAGFNCALTVSADQSVIVGSIKQAASATLVGFTSNIDIDAQLAGVALVEVQTQLSADAVKITDVASSLSSSLVQTTTVTYSAGGDSQLSVSADQTVTGTRQQQGASALLSEFTQTTEIDAINAVSADLSVAFTQSITSYRIQQGESAQASEFTQITAIEFTHNSAVSLSSTATQTAVNDRLRLTSSELSSEFNYSLDDTLFKGISATLIADTAQTATANFTASAQIDQDAIATQLTAAVKNAVSGVDLDTASTLSATATRIQEIIFDQIASTGLDTTLGRRYLAAPATSPTDNDLITISFWAKRDSLTRGYRSNILRQEANNGLTSIIEFVDRDGVVIGLSGINFTNAIYINSPFAGQVGAFWQNVVPQDTRWHHFLVRNVRESFGGETRNNWSLWIDGELQSTENNRGSIIGAFWNVRAYIGSGGTYQSFNTSLTDENFDGALAQFWGGAIPVIDFAVDKFWNYGPRDLGATGRGDNNQLPAPQVYNQLTDPWTGVTTVAGIGGETPTAAVSPLYYNRFQTCEFTMTVGFVGVFLYAIQMQSTTAQTTLTSYRIDLDLDLVSETTLTAEATTQIGIVSDLSSEFNISTVIDKTTRYTSALTTVATLTARGGYEQEITADLFSDALLEADFDNVPPTRAEAQLLGEFTLQAESNSFTNAIILVASSGTLVADITVIAPIRIEADLTATATLTAIIGEIEQFAVLAISLGTMTVNAVKTTGIIKDLASEFTQTTTAKKFTGIVANWSAFYSSLTVGDVINLDPALTYLIPQETREYQIIKETREYIIAQETRELIIIKG